VGILGVLKPQGGILLHQPVESPGELHLVLAVLDADGDAVDRLRRHRRRRHKLERADAYGELATGEVEPVDIDEAATPGWHVHRSVHAALAALPDEQREAVRLAYFGGLTHSEIARELGIPIGTVKTRLRLAFGKLRTALAPIRDWVP
jgi:RNA polymerase sigma-70 factor (ECF subfamily)